MRRLRRREEAGGEGEEDGVGRVSRLFSFQRASSSSHRFNIFIVDSWMTTLHLGVYSA